jgi:hypothetical protein
MKRILKITFIASLLFCQFINAQSPWTKEANKAYVQLGFSGIFYDKMQYDGEKLDLGADYQDITVQVYGEYGLTNNLEFQFILPLKAVSFESKDGSNSQNLTAIGNVSVGMKYKIYDGNWKISTGLLFSANSISKGAKVGLSSGFNAETFLPYISAGTSNGKWYYFANAGYGYMQNTYSDFLKISGEVGYNIIDNGHLIFIVDTKNTISKENAFLNDSNQWPSYSDRQQYSAVGLKFNYEFEKDRFGANFAALGAFNLDNAPAAPSINFGVYSKF